MLNDKIMESVCAVVIICVSVDLNKNLYGYENTPSNNIPNISLIYELNFLKAIVG